MRRPRRSACSSFFRSRSRRRMRACLWRETVSWSSSVATSSGAATRRVRPFAWSVTPLVRKSSRRAWAFIHRTSLSRFRPEHTKRARVHSFPGGEGTPLFRVLIVVLGGGGGVCPPDFACTPARFVCLYIFRLGQYFEVFWQGVCWYEPGGLARIVLQIPQKSAILCGTQPAGGGGAIEFEVFRYLDHGYWLCILLGVQACNGVHCLAHALRDGGLDAFGDEVGYELPDDRVVLGGGDDPAAVVTLSGCLVEDGVGADQT